MNYQINVSRRAKFAICTFFILLPILSWAQYSGSTYANAKSKKIANVTITYSYAPGFAYKGASGQTEGICVDIMNAYAAYMQKNEGIKINFKYISKNPNNFSGFLNDVKVSKGGVFGLSNTTITEARKASYNFSPPYITNMAILISHKSVRTLGEGNMKEIATVFKGMSAVTVKNSTNEKNLKTIKKKYYPSLKIEYVNSFSDAMKVVEKDPTKFTNQDLAYYFEAMKKRSPLKRHPGGDMSKEEFGIIMPKSNDWSPSLEKFMKGYIGSTAYKKVVTKHLGSTAVKFMNSL